MLAVETVEEVEEAGLEELLDDFIIMASKVRGMPCSGSPVRGAGPDGYRTRSLIADLLYSRRTRSGPSGSSSSTRRPRTLTSTAATNSRRRRTRRKRRGLRGGQSRVACRLWARWPGACPGRWSGTWMASRLPPSGAGRSGTIGRTPRPSLTRGSSAWLSSTTVKRMTWR